MRRVGCGNGLQRKRRVGKRGSSRRRRACRERRAGKRFGRRGGGGRDFARGGRGDVPSLNEGKSSGAARATRGACFPVGGSRCGRSRRRLRKQVCRSRDGCGGERGGDARSSPAARVCEKNTRRAVGGGRASVRVLHSQRLRVFQNQGEIPARAVRKGKGFSQRLFCFLRQIQKAFERRRV